MNILSHLYVQAGLSYRSTWSVIIGIGIGPEKHRSVDPYLKLTILYLSCVFDLCQCFGLNVVLSLNTKAIQYTVLCTEFFHLLFCFVKVCNILITLKAGWFGLWLYGDF